MATITLTEDALRQLSLFQDVTGATAMDCLDTADKLMYVIREGEVGKAVGKKGKNVERLKRLTKKDIQLVEYNSDPALFIRNVFRAYGVREVTIGEKDGRPHAIVSVDPLRKGRAIGKGGKNLRMARDLINRHHEIPSVVVD